MNNSARVTSQPQRDEQGVGVLAALWILLVLGAVCNAVTSMLGLNVFISIGFGLVTLASGVALVVRYRRGRAS
jgi:Flp pilus assembly protein TadB